MSLLVDATLPLRVTEIPGPRSRDLAARLAAVECPGITWLAEDFPVFWASARGATVTDVDGNRFVDVTGAFAVANVGHSHPKVVEAVKGQADRLLHGMGDVHPAGVKVELLEALARVVPRPLGQTLLGSSGSDAVEAARKICALHTGRAGLLAFEGAYHGLSYGALEATGRADFRAPFLTQLTGAVRHVPYPDPYHFDGDLDREVCLATCVAAVEAALDEAGEGPGGIGGILVEPIQGRAGTVIPPDGFLRALRQICDARGLLLIFDEIYTGFGRTGRLFACDHEGVVPDLLCLGKGMTGGMPISACVGAPGVMAALGPSRGEALHTQTFLGHPLGAAAAVASIDVIVQEDLPARSARVGAWLLDRLQALRERHPAIGHVRGRGLMVGVELVADRQTRAPAAGLGAVLMRRLLQRGVIALPSGPSGHVLAFSPPLTIEEHQLAHALGALDAELDALGA